MTQPLASIDLSSFDDFAKMALPGQDLSRFRDSYSHALDVNGAVPVWQFGFSFCLHDEDDPDYGYTEEALDILKTFAPAVIYVGTEAAQAQLLALGYKSVVHPYYEDGGLAVVLRVPSRAVLSFPPDGAADAG